MNTDALRLPCNFRIGDSLEVSQWNNQYSLWLGVTQSDSTRCVILSRASVETLRNGLNAWLGDVPYTHAFTDEEYDEAWEANRRFDQSKVMASQPTYDVDALTRAIERLQLAVDANTQAIYAGRPPMFPVGNSGIPGPALADYRSREPRPYGAQMLPQVMQGVSNGR